MKRFALVIAVLCGVFVLKGENVSLAVPTNGAYTGAYIDFGDTEDDVTLEEIERFENLVGKHQAIVASSSYWGEQSFPERNVQLISRHGSVPLIFWSPWDKPYTEERGPDRFGLREILAGKWDAYIDSWGDQAKQFGKPMLVSWGLEMNGAWFPWSGTYYGGGAAGADGGFEGPETYKKAYRYVVDRVRARGAHNIAWVFHVQNYSYPGDDWNTMARYYPGAAYVDWLGMSLYGKQFRTDPWAYLHDLLEVPYADLCKLDPTKPVMLAEWGVGEFTGTGRKSEWIARGFELMPRFPRLKAAVFWHERWQNEDLTYSNLRVNSSPESLEAYRKGVAAPYWLDKPQFRKN